MTNKEEIIKELEEIIKDFREFCIREDGKHYLHRNEFQANRDIKKVLKKALQIQKQDLLKKIEERRNLAKLNPMLTNKDRQIVENKEYNKGYNRALEDTEEDIKQLLK